MASIRPSWNITADILQPEVGWTTEDTIRPVGEHKASETGYRSEPEDRVMVEWPHNRSRLIPFLPLTDFFQGKDAWKVKHNVYSTDGFLTTLDTGAADSALVEEK